MLHIDLYSTNPFLVGFAENMVNIRLKQMSHTFVIIFYLFNVNRIENRIFIEFYEMKLC